ncbi:MAG: hypothetical protein KU37_07220 [Sulfuricurvum sp. PC08-66]|nr:MAG: hypothetical protein KU37_07220 [Sulfuricurvum sp. PC08-66]
MSIAPADEPLLAKLGCHGALDLALHLPKNFEDYRLYPKVQNFAQALEVTINSVQKAPTFLRLSLTLHNLHSSATATIFHPKPYHFAMFKPQAKLYLYAKVEPSVWGLTLSQPKVITKVGTIIPNYASTLRNDTHTLLVGRYVTQEALRATGLPNPIIDTLVALHNVTQPLYSLWENLSVQALYALKFAEIYGHMQRLSTKRLSYEAISSQAQSPQAWIATLPFALTGDQHRAIEAIYGDLRSSTAAKRMVIGDVGAGKTMVILATAYMNAPRRTILMAPTTLLARQLYEEAQKFLPHLPAVLVTQEHYEGQALENYTFLIGTHALLHKNLPDATVVMVDEQHRFGTRQRNLISAMVSQGDKRPHFFQFSATPIPRTQAMVNSAMLEVSLIEETPFVKNITTSIIGKSDFPALLAHLKKEMALGHQAALIYPLVEESETIAYQSLEEARGYWESRFEGVYVTHGKDKQKDEALLGFRENGTILLATTVVEVGISLPRLTTIVIVGAERLGFASLHQLRGRVSRTGLQGYCYLYTHMTKSARLEEFSTLTNGFEVARLDLKYRSSGDVIDGKRQSGAKFRWFDEAEDEAIAAQARAALKH